MNRAEILYELDKAQGHVAWGERHIARQERIVAEFERDSPEYALAVDLLATFRLLQSERLAHRDRLLNELDVAQPVR